jgi:hypothetical protein
MRLHVRFVCLIIPVVLLLSSVTLGAAQGTVSVISKPVRSLLDHRYAHWLPATVAPASGACSAAAAWATPVIVGDFDGDGLADVVMQIQTGTQSRVVIGLNRHDLPKLVELDVPVGPLVVHKRGERYNQTGELSAHYFDVDTLGTDVCGSGDVWLWTGSGFHKTPVTH